VDRWWEQEPVDLKNGRLCSNSEQPKRLRTAAIEGWEAEKGGAACFGSVLSVVFFVMLRCRRANEDLDYVVVLRAAATAALPVVM
jgi:hypothetical protein